MDKSKIAEGLNEAFGDKTVRVIMPKQFLSNLESVLSRQNKELADQVRANNISTELLDAQRETQKLLVELAKAIKENKVKAVEVSNFPAPQPFPKIPEPKEIKFPEIPPYPTHINLIEPKWYQKVQTKFIDFLTDKFQAIKKSFAEDLDSHMDREKALAVRLVDAEGKTFYNAQFYGGGGGIRALTANDVVTANLSAIDNAVLDDIASKLISLSGAGSPTVDSVTSAAINLTANTANQSIITAPGANKQIWIYGMAGSANVAGTISLQDEDDAAITGIMPVSATGGWVLPLSGNFSMPWKKVATNKAVEIDTVTCEFDGIIVYAIVSV